MSYSHFIFGLEVAELLGMARVGMKNSDSIDI